MKNLLFLAALAIAPSAHAYTENRCDNAAHDKAVRMLFDAADNYFVFGELISGGEHTPAVQKSAGHLRPRPGDPNHPLLTLGFGASNFVLALDGESATLTDAGGIVESMKCCMEIREDLPCN